MRKIYILLPLLFFGSAADVLGGVTSFLPVIYASGGKLTGEFSYESDRREVTVGNQPSVTNERTDSQYRETLELAAAGYIYHPALFNFTLEGGGFLEQINSVVGDSSVRLHDASESYDFQGYILEKKPINAKVYVNADRPFLTSGYGEKTSEILRSGVELFYDSRPYRATIKYLRNTRKSSSSTNETDSYVSRLTYSTKVAFYSLAGRRDVAMLNSNIVPGTLKLIDDELRARLRLRSEKFVSVSDAHWKIDDGTNQKNTEIYVQEDLEIDLPKNFTFATRFSRRNVENEALTVNGSDSSSTADSAGVRLTQRLFESLNSAMLLDYSSTEGDTGKTQHRNYLIRTDYSKTLRTGSIQAGLNSRIDQLLTAGPVSPPSELAKLGVGDQYALARADADPSTITVEIEVVDPFGDMVWQFLEKDKNWQVVSGTGVVLVRINDLSGVVGLPGGSGLQYNFRITYRTFDADYTLQTSTSETYATVLMFDKALSVGYAHSFTSQEIVDGESQVIPDFDVIKDRFSFDYLRRPLTVHAEYRILASDFSEKRWEYSFRFVKSVSLLRKIRTTFNAGYSKIGLSFEDEKGQADDSSESSFDSSVATSFLLPYPALTLSNRVLYAMSRGGIESYLQNDTGSYVKTPTFFEEKNEWDVQFAASKLIPALKITVSTVGDYRYEDFLDGTIKKTYGIDFRTNKSWYFGATSISFNAIYGYEMIKSVGLVTHSSIVENKIDLFLKVTRQLF